MHQPGRHDLSVPGEESPAGLKIQLPVEFWTRLPSTSCLTQHLFHAVWDAFLL
jgi:hypothetical protein